MAFFFTSIGYMTLVPMKSTIPYKKRNNEIPMDTLSTPRHFSIRKQMDKLIEKISKIQTKYAQTKSKPQDAYFEKC